MHVVYVYHENNRSVYYKLMERFLAELFFSNARYVNSI